MKAVDYWQARYRSGRHSGAGSRGRLAVMKAMYVNTVVMGRGVRSVLDLGCGDGHVAAMIDAPRYTGVDVPEAVKKARAACKGNHTFATYGAPFCPHDMHLSMDVIFHLTEDDAFDRYMALLFSAQRYVLIYANDTDTTPPGILSHMKYHSHSRWVRDNAPEWKLLRHDANPYPRDSVSSFYLYEKR